MISEKMIKLASGSSTIRAMFEEGSRLQALYGKDNVFDFSIGNPNFPAPPEVKEAVIDIISSEESASVHGYMSNAGFEEVRQAVAESVNRRFGTSFDLSNIIMTVGAAGGLNVIFKTLLNPGDEVITFSPYFLEYGNYVNNFDGVLVPVPSHKHTFQPDPLALKAAVTSKTKAVIINNPNNPTGVVYSEDSVKRIAEVLAQKEKELGTSIYIISDEPYRELVYDGVEVPCLTKFYKNTIIGYSWSKSLSLPGERIGYLVLPTEMDEYQLIFNAAVIANRILGFVNAPSLLQKVVARCLDARVDVSAYDKNRKLLYDGLTGCGFECAKPQGAFYMWIKSPIEDDISFVNAAKEFNLLLVPGSAFNCPGYARIAYCVSHEKIQKSLPAFKKLSEKFGLK